MPVYYASTIEGLVNSSNYVELGAGPENDPRSKNEGVD